MKPPRSGDDEAPEYDEPRAPHEHAFFAGSQTLDRELEGFLRSLNQRMGWIYPVEFSHIPMSAYRAMVQLCILDRAAGDLSLEERSAKVLLAHTVALELRAMPSWQEVVHAFEAAWAHEAMPKELKEHINDPLTQHKLAARTVRLALHAGDTRVAVKALEQINDRAMPAIREKSETRVLLVTPEMAALITDTLRMVDAKPVHELPALRGAGDGG